MDRISLSIKGFRVHLTDAERAQALWDSDPTHPIFDPHPNLSEPSQDARDPDRARERYEHGTLWTRLDDPTAWETYPDPDDPEQ